MRQSGVCRILRLMPTHTQQTVHWVVCYSGCMQGTSSLWEKPMSAFPFSLLCLVMGYMWGDIKVQNEGCVSANTRLLITIKTGQCVFWIHGRSFQAAGASSIHCHGFESPPPAPPTPNFFALLNNPWIIHPLSYQTNIFATCTYKYEGRPAVPYCI